MEVVQGKKPKLASIIDDQYQDGYHAMMAKESGVSIAQTPKEKDVIVEEEDDIKVQSEMALFVPRGDARRLTI